MEFTTSSVRSGLSQPRTSSCGPETRTPSRPSDALTADRRVIEVHMLGEPRWAAVEDAGRLRDALGIQPPTGVAHAFLETLEDPLGDVVGRYARTHGPFAQPKRQLRR